MDAAKRPTSLQTSSEFSLAYSSYHTLSTLALPSPARGGLASVLIGVLSKRPSLLHRWVLTDCAAHPEARCVIQPRLHTVGNRRPRRSPHVGPRLRGCPDSAECRPRVHVCRLSISTTRICLQVVQRSLSGGFLTQDAALLNANACSMSYVSDEARDNMPWERAALTRATRAQGGEEEHHIHATHIVRARLHIPHFLLLLLQSAGVGRGGRRQLGLGPLLVLLR